MAMNRNLVSDETTIEAHAYTQIDSVLRNVTVLRVTFLSSKMLQHWRNNATHCLLT
jgi:ABC-type protease/lipase transport system fused ATPase/permease subunit